jgi:hypothetical protein
LGDDRDNKKESEIGAKRAREGGREKMYIKNTSRKRLSYKNIGKERERKNK